MRESAVELVVAGEECAERLDCSAVADVLRELAAKARAVCVASAYVGKGGPELAGLRLARENGAEVRAVVQEDRGTTPDGLAELLNAVGDAARIIPAGAAVFAHAKMYIFDCADDGTYVLLGSSNLTRAGVEGVREDLGQEQVEANILLKAKRGGPLAEVARQCLELFEYLYEKAQPLTAEFVEEYCAEHQRKSPISASALTEDEIWEALEKIVDNCRPGLTKFIAGNYLLHLHELRWRLPSWHFQDSDTRVPCKLQHSDAVRLVHKMPLIQPVADDEGPYVRQCDSEDLKPIADAGQGLLRTKADAEALARFLTKRVSDWAEDKWGCSEKHLRHLCALYDIAPRGSWQSEEAWISHYIRHYKRSRESKKTPGGCWREHYLIPLGLLERSVKGPGEAHRYRITTFGRLVAREALRRFDWRTAPCPSS